MQTMGDPSHMLLSPLLVSTNSSKHHTKIHKEIYAYKIRAQQNPKHQKHSKGSSKSKRTCLGIKNKRGDDGLLLPPSSAQAPKLQRKPK